MKPYVPASFKDYAEQELLMIHLNLKLEAATETEQNITETSTPVLTYA